MKLFFFLKYSIALCIALCIVIIFYFEEKQSVNLMILFLHLSAKKGRLKVKKAFKGKRVKK